MEIFKKYKSVWMFLLRFFGAYIIGVFLYNSYLSQYVTEVDNVTRMVTEQVATMLSVTLPEISCVYSTVNPMAEIQYFGVTLMVLIEGCNAISVMILFVAFLVAFQGKLKTYFWFVPSGILILYLANLVRIYLIGMIILYFPSWTNLAHDYVFPGVIYGTTFILWVVWVKYFTKKRENE
ncbi:MAG: exosortase family protein XrtF [Salibacteraceae bacterium]